MRPFQAKALIDVLRFRERKRRLALARVAGKVATERGGVEAAGALIQALQDRMQTCRGERYAGGSRSIAALSEVEAHVKLLRAQGTKMLEVKQKAERALQELLAEQRASARQWQRSDAALAHVRSIDRRGRILRDIRRAELEDEERP